jgi:DUF3048 family protein
VSHRRVAASAACVVVALAGCGSGGAGGPVPGARPTTAASPAPAPVCPLTGAAPRSGAVPQRPALAVKVDNAPAARPQAGLGTADLVYEEPVEGGLTRFVAVFQCSDAEVIEPVRSARLVDPDLLVQFGRPLFAYAGGIDPVVKKVASSTLRDVGLARAAAAYHRDRTRPAPYNLATSTAALWREGVAAAAPAPVFDHGPVAGAWQPAGGLRIPFSAYSDVTWSWDRTRGAWLRGYLRSTAGPAVLVGGAQVATANVIVQHVTVAPSPYVEDRTGTHEWEVSVTGSGPVSVYRNGGVVVGTWERATVDDRTRWIGADGRPITLAPGATWIELVPADITVLPAP